MAYPYNRSHSRNSSTGLGSSISCLDGVPFKVGTKFKPPPRVFLPPELANASRRRHVLNKEYLFETEEGVLRWAQAREEAKVEQERLRAERVAKSIQELSQPQNSDSDSSGEENGTTEIPFQQSVMAPKEAPVPAPRSVFPNLSNDILTPVPIVPAKPVEPQKQDVPQPVNFDLALFEQEDDPFENVERQLINEMEELKSVLDPVKPPDVQGNNSNCDTNVSNSINNTSHSPAFNSNPENTVPSQTFIPQSGVENHYLAKSGSPVPVFVPRTDRYEEGDYVELKMDYKNSVAFKASNQNGNSEGTDDSSSRKVDPAASGVYKPVLPPIGGLMPKLRPVSSPAPDFIAKSDIQETFSADVMPSAVNHGMANGVYNKYSRHRNSSPGAAIPPNEGMRSARSNPDLSNSKSDINSQAHPVSHSPPLRPSSGQMWNPYKPLPPTPDIMSSLRTPSSTNSSSSDLVSPSEFDPYVSLSNESQQFVLRLTSMGFNRQQVARAVHKHGTDDKQVVEYLCQVNQLVDKGYNAIHAETALNLFDCDANKAERYLEMFFQFRELGFGPEKIREALVKENMDRDKVLDYLTA